MSKDSQGYLDTAFDYAIDGAEMAFETGRSTAYLAEMFRNADDPVKFLEAAQEDDIDEAWERMADAYGDEEELDELADKAASYWVDGRVEENKIFQKLFGL